MSTPNELLAGLSIMTILSLKHADEAVLTSCITSAGPDKDGRYAGWILTPEGRPVLNTPSRFETGADAMEHLKKVVAACRDFTPMSAASEGGELEKVELFAWVGEDEFKPGEFGLKSGLTPVGWIPLVSVRLDRMNDPELVAQMQTITNKYDKPRRLVRFVYTEMVLEVTPKTDGNIHAATP